MRALCVSRSIRSVAVLAIACGPAATATLWAGDSWADHVISYDAGSTPAFGYTDSSAALGSPEHFTGEGFGFPSVVSPFSPAFGTEEIVSIGEGGSLVVGFDDPIRDAGSNLYGVDFLVFGNAGFIDDDYPNGRTTDPAEMFGVKPFVRLAVSADGVNFVDLGEFSAGFFPAMGYLDAGPYDTEPGNQPADYTRPVDPALSLTDFNGKTLAQIRALYDGSGGGTPVDLAGSGLSEIAYVRVDVLDDGDSDTSLHAEIDGFGVVPEPGALMLLAVAIVSCARRRG